MAAETVAMQAVPVNDDAPTGRKRGGCKAVVPAPGARLVAMPQAPGVVGRSETALRQDNARLVEKGLDPFLIRVGGRTMVHVPRFEAAALAGHLA
jgi:hypothetical protein